MPTASAAATPNVGTWALYWRRDRTIPTGFWFFQRVVVGRQITHRKITKNVLRMKLKIERSVVA